MQMLSNQRQLLQSRAMLSKGDTQRAAHIQWLIIGQPHFFRIEVCIAGKHLLHESLQAERLGFNACVAQQACAPTKWADPQQ
jgi:hypothetical protein